MLSSAGLSDDPGLAHAPGEQDLAQHIIDLVRTGMVQLVALEIDLRAAEMLGQARREIERRGAAHIVPPQILHLRLECPLFLGLVIRSFEIQDQRHQGLGHETPAMQAETALLVGARAERVRLVRGHRAVLR